MLFFPETQSFVTGHYLARLPVSEMASWGEVSAAPLRTASTLLSWGKTWISASGGPLAFTNQVAHESSWWVAAQSFPRVTVSHTCQILNREDSAFVPWGRKLSAAPSYNPQPWHKTWKTHHHNQQGSVYHTFPFLWSRLSVQNDDLWRWNWGSGKLGSTLSMEGDKKIILS